MLHSDSVPTVDNVEIEIPSLGNIKGITYENELTQFLGIKYADIPGRFRRSIPAAEPWVGGSHDGTKLGPYCPQPPRDFYPIPNPETRTWLNTPTTDEFECLNLNISVPRLPSADEKPLPVMVFLHGGAFVYASGNSPIYDGRILSSNSAALALPTIIITLNYRIGVYGFLAGTDIAEYNRENGEEGVGNYGLWDQVLALRWIQKHIGAFGGDRENVTVFGQSAGGVSVHAHLLRNEALFSRAILQSGTIRLCGVFSVAEYQIMYEKMLLALSIPLSLSPRDRLQRFLEADVESVTAAMIPVFITPVITLGPCDDGVLLPQGVPTFDDYDIFPKPAWCKEVMLGDARNECIIWNKAWDVLSPTPMSPTDDLSAPSAALLLAKMTSYLGPTKAQAIATVYKITPDLSSRETFDVLETMTTHAMYSLPIYFATQAQPDAYAWHFDVPSPFENAWGGMAHHSFDNVLIWGVLRHRLPEGQQRMAGVLTEKWVRFANGLEPWERFADKRRWCYLGIEGAQMRAREENEGWGYALWEEIRRLGLVRDFMELGEELCIRRSELVERGNLVGAGANFGAKGEGIGI